jgi:pimeloyl-ACP methyl ester carboxylesterase
MTVDPRQLLKRLEPPVRPGGAPAWGRPGRAPIEGQRFDDLLTLVSRGEIDSTRPVESRLMDDAALSDEQLARLASAADLAQANGARRAVMFIDGRALLMDVAARNIEDELTAEPSHRLFEIDAAVLVASGEDPPFSPAASHLRWGAPLPPLAPTVESAQDSQTDQ